ncbi:MAG: glycosyl hydrolase family 18 protein [Candidatus Eremiobacteraeota bacterium]|nr:glycosyl hydrolase family 18 protein [Candidatus Eremiobacteraeota bacterium]
MPNQPWLKATALAAIVSLTACGSPSRQIVDPPVIPAASQRSSALQSEAAVPTGSKRVIYYYQTQYSNGQYVSLSPIWSKLNPKTHKPPVTDVMIAAFHLGHNTDGSPYIHLNDNVPQDPMFNIMWPEVATLQGYGVTTRMMLGGAAQGSYALLFSDWNTFYPILKSTLQQYKLNGIDLDVEETVSLTDIEKLIKQLHADFGSSFLITLSPVCSALWGGANLSGFDYTALYKSPAGADVAWFNGQFYSGFGSLQTPSDYEHVLAAGTFPADKVVAGLIANPNDGYGYVPVHTIAGTVKTLVAKYPTFGGVADWEYFDALPGGPADPVRWARIMRSAL